MKSMPKATTSFELTLADRPAGQTLTAWLYAHLRLAIIDGRFRPGTRLPASREFARQYGISRGTVVSVLERLQTEGYVSCKVGSGTRVKCIEHAPAARSTSSVPPAYIRRVLDEYRRPRPWLDLTGREGVQPFCMRDPAIVDFPAELWGTIAARRARKLTSWIRTEDDGRGYGPLRQAIADYLSSSRGVRCDSGQIVIVSGAQQALDLLARFLLKAGDPVWMEDPGYFGASIALANAGARVIPVPPDEQGLSIAAGLQACRQAKGVYVTPAHQFPLGITMTLERRMQLVQWAARSGAFVIEDDYDSEYRFEGRPVPVLQSLDRNANVILIGSFNKLLFPSVRIGYVVLPPPLADVFTALKYRTDFYNVHLDQVVLCDFITEGHFGRHLRRMRDLYAGRLGALIEAGKQHLRGLLEIQNVRAGLYTAGFLQNGMSSKQAEKAAAAHDIEVMGLHRYTLQSADPRGLLLGFGAFDEKAIRSGVVSLAAALGGKDASKTLR